MASAWEIKNMPKFDKLNADTTAEVCVVGGGIAGVWCAYLLAKSGKHVVVLEADRLGRSATLYTTGFLTQSIDTDLADLVSALGAPTTRKIIKVHGEAIDLIDRVVAEEGIECEFVRTDDRTFAQNGVDLKRLEEEQKLAEKLGFDVEFRKTPFKGFKNLGGMIWKRQAKYHPIKFFNGLVEAAVENGVEFFEKTEVESISGRSALSVKTKDGKTVRAKDVVVATYDPFNNPKPVHFKKGMYKSYVYELSIPREVIPEGIYEDDDNPYHYFRVDRGEKSDRLIVGGEDHRAELTKVMKGKSFKVLKKWISETFPGLKYEVENKWPGGILEPSDGLALIGEYAPHQYLATAFSGNGMTYSAIAGAIITDLIYGKKNSHAAIFDPKRKLNKKLLAKKLRDYGEEFFRGAGKNIFA